MTKLFYGLRTFTSNLPILFAATHLAPNETHLGLIWQEFKDLISLDWRRDEASASMLEELFKRANIEQPPLTPETPLCVYAVFIEGRDNGAVWSGLVRSWHMRKLKRLKRRGVYVIAGCCRREEALQELMSAASEEAQRQVALLDMVSHGYRGVTPCPTHTLLNLAPDAHVLFECCEAAYKEHNDARQLSINNPSVSVWASQHQLAEARVLFKVRAGRLEVRDALCVTSLGSVFWGTRMKRYQAGQVTQNFTQS